MNERETRRLLRLRQKVYFNSLAELRKAHHKLFDSRGSQSVVTRRLGFHNPKLFLAEGCLRLLAKDPRLKTLASQFFLAFSDEFGPGAGADAVEVSRLA